LSEVLLVYRLDGHTRRLGAMTVILYGKMRRNAGLWEGKFHGHGNGDGAVHIKVLAEPH
jgi:hypothetical protein